MTSLTLSSTLSEAISVSATESSPCSFESDCLLSKVSSSVAVFGSELELVPKFADVLLLRLATSSRGRDDWWD